MPRKVRVIAKPWGRELWLAVERRYAGKILEIKKGHRLSLQYHRKKHESLFALKGKWRLLKGRRWMVMNPGQAEVIPPRTPHRMEAPWEPVRIVEVSTPDLEDVVRLEDDYGRSSLS